MMTLIFVVVSSFSVAASEGEDENPAEEISVFVTMRGIGSLELPAYINDGIIYLSVTDLFDFLRIKNQASPGLDTVRGYFIDPAANFIIDHVNRKISYRQKVHQLQLYDIVKTNTNLYLKSDYFGTIFGIDAKFNFRSLSVTLSTNIELPAFKEQRLVEMRSNLNRLKGVVKSDTTIGNTYAFFNLGMLDWSVIANQAIKGEQSTMLNLRTGFTLASGELNTMLNYNSTMPITFKEQFYQWRFVNNNLSAFKQVQIGKVFPQSVSSLFAAVNGIQLTNTATNNKRSFGTYTLSNYTQPNWTVELYVNNIMVDYVVADASGFFSFQVPLMYGNTIVKLRHYGPYGEERFTEQSINIPFNFMPKNKLEYNIVAGIVEDSLKGKFARSVFNYGLNNAITIGGGLEYFSTVQSGAYMPFVHSSVRLAKGILFSAEYTHGVRYKTVVSYQSLDNLMVELNYTHYKKEQKAVNSTFLEERKMVISYPFQTRTMSLFSRLSVFQLVLPSNIAAGPKVGQTKYTNVELLLSGILGKASTNFTTYAFITKSATPYIYSNLAMIFRLPAKMMFTPQVQFAYNKDKVISVKGELGKYIAPNSFLNIFFEQNFKSKFSGAGIGFRYDFSFAQISLFTRKNNNNYATMQSASGSIMYDSKSNHVAVSRQANVSRGGITVFAFLDINANGRQDDNEPRVTGINLQINGGRIKHDKKDTAYYISGLEAYTSYTIKISNQFDNISWRIKNQLITVVVDANQFKLVKVPVAIMGEVSGNVYLNANGAVKELGRILVNFYRVSDNSFVSQIQTEEDGYFDFIGLAPGEYYASIDPAQTRKLNLKAVPARKYFTIKILLDGDVVEGLDFVLEK